MKLAKKLLVNALEKDLPKIRGQLFREKFASIAYKFSKRFGKGFAKFGNVDIEKVRILSKSYKD